MSAKALTVAVRCRTVLPHDRDQRCCVKAVGNNEIECLDPEHLHAELRAKHGRYDYLKENRNRERAYTFDITFGPTATNDLVFEAIALPLIPEVLAGKNATCFAYGQTGSGKTHTMLGRQGEAGLIERTLHELVIRVRSTETQISVTFVEVYNEKIRDLLQPGCPCLELRDGLQGSSIAGVHEVPFTSAEKVMELVREGNSRRTEECTAANPVSSRSHAILQLSVETELFGHGGPRKKRVAKLSLIDLAGSERAASTGNKGARLQEGAMINRSLLALANCITALTQKGAYVNYRDSKLTRLLKSSLSGNCYTSMIAHVSPSIASFEETLNTLKYAHRACEIRGMCGGVRENVCEVAPSYGDRIRPCLEATNGLKKAVEKLAPQVKPPPPKVRPRAASPSLVVSKAVIIADELEKTRQKVVRNLRGRVSLEQTALELGDQNESNAIELSKIELDAVLEDMGSDLLIDVKKVTWAEPGPNGPDGHLKLLKMHEALRAATKKNALRRQQLEEKASAREKHVDLEGKGEAHLMALLTDAKVLLDTNEGDVSDVEKRLLHAQHALALLEIEKVEGEQERIILEGAARQRDLALRKQKLQMDVQTRALLIAETLFAERGLADLWHAALGPLANLLPTHVVPPSLDELISQVSGGGNADGSVDEKADGANFPENNSLRDIDEGFSEMRASLRQTSTKFNAVNETEESDEEGSHAQNEEQPEEEGDDEDEQYTCMSDEASADKSLTAGGHDVEPT